MKVTLEFDSDESYDAKLAMRAGELASSMEDIQNYIRGILKHAEISEETAKYLEIVRDLTVYIEP